MGMIVYCDICSLDICNHISNCRIPVTIFHVRLAVLSAEQRSLLAPAGSSRPENAWQTWAKKAKTCERARRPWKEPVHHPWTSQPASAKEGQGPHELLNVGATLHHTVSNKTEAVTQALNVIWCRRHEHFGRGSKVLENDVLKKRRVMRVMCLDS